MRPLVRTLLLAVFAALLGLAVAALAAPGDAGDARVTSTKTLPAGASTRVSIEVRSTGPQPINFLLFRPGSGMTVTAAAPGPGAWSGTVVDNRAIFTGGSLGVNQTATFSIDVKAVAPDGALPAADTRVVWTVEGSSDGGMTKALFGPTAAGALDQTIHVLAVDGAPVVTSPAGAIDGSVTAGQDVWLRWSVANAGSATLDVQLRVSAVNGTTESTRTVSLAPGAWLAVTTRVAAGSAGSSTFTPTARTPDGTSVAIGGAPLRLTVQYAAFFACSTIAPGAANGAAPVTYSMGLGGAGAFPLRYDATLTIGSTPPVTKTRSLVQSVSTITLSFPDTSIPPTASEGTHFAHVSLVGTDANGAAFSTEVACGSTVIDRVPPVVVGNVPVPPSLNLPEDPAARQTAVKSGDAVTFTARILDGGAAACTAIVKRTAVRVLDASGVPLSSAAGPSPATSRYAGRCEVSWSQAVPTLPGTAAFVDAELVVHDAAGNVASGLTSRIPVDAARPALASATIVAKDSVDVLFSECVRGSSLLADWSASPYPARSLATIPCAAGAPGFAGVRLTIAPLLDERETPRVTYTQTLPDAAAPAVALLLQRSIWYVDGAGHRLASPQSIPSASGIRPPAPRITGVTPGQRFATNGGPDKRPVFLVSGVTAGLRVCVHESSLGEIGCTTANADGSGAAVRMAQPLTGPDRILSLTAYAYSATGLQSAPGTGAVRYDTRGPVVDRATIESGGLLGSLGLGPTAYVKVRFAEDVTGPDRIGDWALHTFSGGAPPGVVVSSIERCEGEERRCIAIGVDAASDDAWQAIARVSYVPAGTRYVDDAGNAAAFGTYAYIT